MTQRHRRLPEASGGSTNPHAVPRKEETFLGSFLDERFPKHTILSLSQLSDSSIPAHAIKELRRTRQTDSQECGALLHRAFKERYKLVMAFWLLTTFLYC